MKNNRHMLATVLDMLSIIVGCTIWILMFVFPDMCCLSKLTSLAGVIGIAYIVYAVCLISKRPVFDWHLIHGNFLRKVICLVVLMPFVFSIFVPGDLNPEELAYEDVLYESYVNQHALKQEQVDPPMIWSIYYHFIDPGNQHMTTTKAGRGWAALISILGIFLLNGLLVSSIVGWVDSRKERWQKGEIRYKCFLKRNQHYVIIGGNDMVPGIVDELLKKIASGDDPDKARYILIQTVRDVENFRRELFSNLNVEQQKKIIIYYGNRNSTEDIEALVLETAAEVFVLGEETRTDDIESYHDTMNMKCLNLLLEVYKTTSKAGEITSMLPKIQTCREELSAAEDSEEIDRIRELYRELDTEWGRRPCLKCRVMFEYQATFSVYQFFDIKEELNAYIDFRPFNYYELWAQKVFVNMNLDKSAVTRYLPLEGVEGIPVDSKKHVHLFVIGMSRAGVAMAVEAAHMAHYPNFEKNDIRTKITFIDKNAKEEKDFFMGRFKELFSLSHWRYGTADGNELSWETVHEPCANEYLGGDFIDVEWEFVNGGVESSVVQDYILASATPTAVVTIAVCLPESNRSHAGALYLSKKIFESESVQQVLVYNRYGDSIINKIDSVYPYSGKLKCFGYTSESFIISHLDKNDELGVIIDDAYYQGFHKFNVSEIKFAGKSRSTMMWSSIYNGNTAWTKLRCIDFDPLTFGQDRDVIEILADVEHNRWNLEELLMNFRPLTLDEQNEQLKKGNADKNALKAKMAHVDICSNKRLLEIDRKARKYDITLTEYLGKIYEQFSN